MKTRVTAAIAASLALVGACVPAGGGNQAGSGPGGSSAAQSSIATSREIGDYVSNGSAFIEYFEGSAYPGSYECGYFDPGGDYESFWTDYSDDDEFYGGWSVRGSQLCFHGQWVSGDQHFGCNVAEWSLDDTLLLIDGRDRVVAEISTYDGPGEYIDECFL